MPSLPIVGIKMLTICILGIETPSPFTFLGIVMPGLPIIRIETPTISILGIEKPSSFTS